MPLTAERQLRLPDACRQQCVRSVQLDEVPCPVGVLPAERDLRIGSLTGKQQCRSGAFDSQLCILDIDTQRASRSHSHS